MTRLGMIVFALPTGLKIALACAGIALVGMAVLRVLEAFGVIKPRRPRPPI